MHPVPRFGHVLWLANVSRLGIFKVKKARSFDRQEVDFSRLVSVLFANPCPLLHFPGDCDLSSS